MSLRSQIKDLTVQAAYTYSRAYDAANNASNGGDGGDLDYVTNPYVGWKGDWGPSEYNRQNVAFVNFIYDLPFLRNSSHHVLRTVAGGWQVSGVVTMESGLPSTLTVGGGRRHHMWCRRHLRQHTTEPGRTNQLSEESHDLNQQSNGTKQWFSPSAFAANLLPGSTKVATWGNLKYDGVWGPGRDNWNIALFKNFKFTERLNMELRFESYNTFNHPQMNGLDVDLGDPDFGKVTSAFDPRVFQLGGKILF